MKYWEITRQTQQSRLELGCSSEIDSTGRVIFTADAYARDSRRFGVLSDEKLRALLEFEGTIRAAALGCTAWSDDSCLKSLVEEIMRLRDQP